MSVSDEEFETMRARARVYRIRLAELGPVSEPVILENVRDRLDLRPTETLPPAQGELAHEIFALLEDRRLNTLQARTLEREFFGN